MSDSLTEPVRRGHSMPDNYAATDPVAQRGRQPKHSPTSIVTSSMPPPPPPASASPIRESDPRVPIYRKHSRKRSNQVLIPPIQVARRKSVKSSGAAAGETTVKRRSRAEHAEGNDDLEDAGSDEFDEEDEDEDDAADDPAAYIDGQGRKRQSVLTPQTLASGATLLIGAQFFSKLVTFGLNQSLLRYASPELMGANAQFELFINTILYFSREAVRLAAQRQTLVGKSQDVYRFEGGVAHGTQSGTIQEVINIGFVPLLAGLPLAVTVSLLYHFKWASNLQLEYTGTAIIIFAASAIIELISEPSFLLSQLLVDFKTRASIESATVMARCLVTFAVVMLSRQWGQSWGSSLIPFALGQLAYSTVTTILYTRHGLKTSEHQQYRVTFVRPVWKDTLSSQQKMYLNPETWTLAVGISLQTVFKHCLSEGDKFLVSILLPITGQGVYALVANYGSLVARLAFLPIEEALRGFFSKLLSEPEEKGSPIPHTPDDDSTNSPTSTPGTSRASDFNLSVTVLSTILRLYVYLDVIVCIFGPLVARYFLSWLAPPAWLNTDAPKVLATYACYIPFLAVNGCLEAFVQSVASVEDIRRQGSAMIAFSLSFAVAGYVLMDLLDLGAQGLVYANMFNMSLRIVWCTRYIERYYKHSLTTFSSLDSWAWIRKACPNTYVVALSIAAAAAAWHLGPVNTPAELLKQAALGVVLVGAMLFSERELVATAWQKWGYRR